MLCTTIYRSWDSVRSIELCFDPFVPMTPGVMDDCDVNVVMLDLTVSREPTGLVE